MRTFCRVSCYWLFLLAICGCGSSDPYDDWGGMSQEEYLAWREKEIAQERAQSEAEDAAIRKAEDERQAAQKTASATPPPAATPVQTAASTSPIAGVDGEEPADSPRQEDAQPPVRPDDLAQWRHDDYLKARSESDPRLAAAVELLAKDPSPQAAKTLLSLLTREPSSGGPASFVATESASTPWLVAAVSALANHPSPQAQAAFEQVLSGAVPTVEDVTVFRAAVSALAQRNDPAAAPLLTKTLASRQAFHQADQWPVLVDTLVAALGPAANWQSRMALASYLAGLPVDNPSNSRLWQYLELARWENLPAQAMLYRLGGDDQRRQRFEANLTGFASMTWESLLQIPPGDRNAAPAAATWQAPADEATGPGVARPDQTAEYAAALWSREIGSLLAERLFFVNSLFEHAPLLMLSATFPHDTVRGALLDALERNWQDGPAAFMSAGFPQWPVTEPGLIPALKIASRRALENGPRHSRVTAIATRQNTDAWNAAAEQLVTAVCRRMESAARGRLEKRTAAAANAPPAAFPLAFHPQARVVLRFDVAWPADLPRAAGSTVDPLVVRYARIEETSRAKSVAAYYARQLSGAEVRDSDRARWFSKLGNDTQRGTVQSTDVIVRRLAAAPASTRDAAEKLSVDLLYIEVHAPQPKPEQGTTASDKR